MSLIFDSFPNRGIAESFAEHVRINFPKREVAIFDTQEKSNEVDPFPFELIPPIVQVERLEDYSDEVAIQRIVKQFKGEFAGT